MATYFDDPNREAVGLEPCWVEGTGGVDASARKAEPEQAKPKTKAELLAEAEARGLDVSDSMTKAEIEEALAG